MNACKFIEAIAKQDDRSRSIVFFLFFARFEYALKRAGFIKLGGAKTEAQADWDTYAEQHSHLVMKKQEKYFTEAVAYLAKSPPKKQIVVDGRLEWADDQYLGPFDLPRVLVLVRRIRNNLFHGGKFQTHVEADVSRDGKLLDASLVIMQACLDSDDGFQHIFVEGLSW